jgi:tetratricopeptide (TPR) repeat protein
MTSDEPETFADVVRRLRKAANETQTVFGQRFHKSRNYITNTERGELTVEEFMHDLIAAFPAEKKPIEAAYTTSLDKRPQKATPVRETPLQRRIEDLLRGGRLADAEQALDQALRESDDNQQRHWIYERLHVTLLAQLKQDAADEALIEAIGCAANADLKIEEISSRERLASRYQQDDKLPAAIDVLEGGLDRYPDAADLWLRKGKVHWYEEEYCHAYAALTTALYYGSQKHSVLYARSQVLAEWENFEAALADIAAYLSCAGIEPVDEAQVRSTRAYIWGQMDDLERALAEFDAISASIPYCGWLYYRRARCYIKAGQEDDALHDLLLALRCERPPLDRRRKRHAEAILRKRNFMPPFP